MGNWQERTGRYTDYQRQMLEAELEFTESRESMGKIWTPDVVRSYGILEQFNCRQLLEQIRNQIWMVGEVKESAGVYYKYPSMGGLDRSEADSYTDGASVGLYISYPYTVPAQDLEETVHYYLYWLSVSLGITAHFDTRSYSSEIAHLVIWKHKTKYFESIMKWNHPIVNDDENCGSLVIKVNALNAVQTVRNTLNEFCKVGIGLSEEVERQKDYVEDLKAQGKLLIEPR